MTYKFEKTLTLYIETDSKKTPEEFIKNLIANDFNECNPQCEIKHFNVESSNWKVV